MTYGVVLEVILSVVIRSMSVLGLFC